MTFLEKLQNLQALQPLQPMQHQKSDAPSARVANSIPDLAGHPYVYGLLPFAVDWEVWRVDQHQSLDLNNGGKWQTSLQANVDNPKIIWNSLRERLASTLNIQVRKIVMPEASSNRAWDLIQTKGWTDGQVHLKLTVDLLPNGGFTHTPRPMVVTSSRRIYRKYGADRFLSVTVVTSIVRTHANELKRFLQNPLMICGRRYRVFFARPTQEALYAHYFATDGAGLQGREVSMDALMEWLLSLNKNCTEKAPKLWSRISLALSSTKPSIVFTRDQIRIVEDIESTSRECMTDGCARASPAVFREIWLSGVLSSKETPTAIQGRIGAAKGVWYIDPLADYRSEEKWVEIRRSQLKFNYDPMTFQDPMLRTLVNS